jgi:hypothetical protein
LLNSTRDREQALAKNNYSYEKRQKELKRQEKKAAKKERKLERQDTSKEKLPEDIDNTSDAQ